MIPSNEEIFKRLNREQIEYILLNQSNYFRLVEEFTNLQKVFDSDNLYDKLMLWFEMLISPLITIVQSIMNGSMSMFSMLGFQKTFMLWKDWFRWRELRDKIRIWMSIVKSVGGPYISTNDADYHMFVYADAMVRIQEGLLFVLVSKKRTKGFK